MAANTVTLYNAALSGALGGMLDSRAVGSTTSSDYTGLVSAASAFASAVDAAFGTVTALSTSMAVLMSNLCRSPFSSRFSLDAVQADWVSQAAAVKAAYNASSGLLQ